MVIYGVLLTLAPSFERYHIPYKEKQVLCMETESEKISEPRREWDLAMGELWMQKASDTMRLRCNSIGPALNLQQKLTGLSVQWGSHSPGWATTLKLTAHPYQPRLSAGMRKAPTSFPIPSITWISLAGEGQQRQQACEKYAYKREMRSKPRTYRNNSNRGADFLVFSP